MRNDELEARIEGEGERDILLRTNISGWRKLVFWYI